jgi:hypothetical protein
MSQPANNSTPQMKQMYTLGGIAALLMVSIIVIQLIIFIAAPPPLEGTVTDWFALFQENYLIGLLDFELLMIIYTLVSLVLYIALYFAMKPTHPPFMALFLLMSVIGVGAFIAARPSFEMLRLSNQYVATTSEAQRSVYLASGETLIAIFHGTSFHVSYVLGSVSGLLLSFVMLKGDIFSRKTAYVRIASSVFDFGLFIPGVGTMLSIFAILLLMVWDILIARRLFQLGHVAEPRFVPVVERTK